MVLVRRVATGQTMFHTIYTFSVAIHTIHAELGPVGQSPRVNTVVLLTYLFISLVL